MLPQYHNYQIYAINHIMQHPKVGLFLDMGLGKTLITLTAFSELARQGFLNGNVLIVAPKMIAVNTWPAEIKKWDHLKDTRFVQLAGITGKKAKKAYDDLDTWCAESKAIQKNKLTPDQRTVPPAIYIINRDLISKLATKYEKNWPFPNIVLDELQSFKGYKSKRTKTLSKILPFTERVVGLTGTPAPNNLMDLWAQIYILDEGQRLGPNITTYRNSFFDPGRRTPEGYPYEWHLKPYAEDAIYHRISDIAISMKSQDYLQLPAVTYNDIVVDMSKKEMTLYRQLKQEHVLPLLDGTTITAANAAVLGAKLQQLANGAIYIDNEDGSRAIIQFHNRKIEALEQMVDSLQGEPVIVFYWYQHDLTRIKDAIPDAFEFDGDPKTVESWNRKEIPILLLHPASAAHGLNLQEGGHTIVWFSLPLSLEHWLQGNARVARQGQTKPVIIHRIKTMGTIDNKRIIAINDKKEVQDSLLQAVKACL